MLEKLIETDKRQIKKVLHFSLSLIQDEHQYIFTDILKTIEKDCPEYAQLDNERLTMLPDILHLQIKKKKTS